MLPRTGRPKRSAMGVSGTNRPSHVYAEHVNARDSYHGCTATPQRAGPGGRARCQGRVRPARRSTTRITQDLYTHVRYEVHAAAAAQIVDLLRPQRSAEGGRAVTPCSARVQHRGFHGSRAALAAAVAARAAKNTATVRPLDGLSFSLPASSGLVGATLVVLLRDRDEHGEARKHAYQLVPLDLTNEMQYHGELG